MLLPLNEEEQKVNPNRRQGNTTNIESQEVTSPRLISKHLQSNFPNASNTFGRQKRSNLEASTTAGANFGMSTPFIESHKATGRDFGLSANFETRNIDDAKPTGITAYDRTVSFGASQVVRDQ